MKLDGCEFGLVSLHCSNKGQPIKKPWRVDSDCCFVLQNLDRQCSKTHVHAPFAGRDTKESERYTSSLVAAVHSAFAGWCQLRVRPSVPAACVRASAASLSASFAARTLRGYPSDVYGLGGAKGGKPPAPRPPSPRPPTPPRPPVVRRPAASVPKPPQPPQPRTLRADIRAWDAERAALGTTRRKGIPTPPLVKATTSKASASGEGLPLAAGAGGDGGGGLPPAVAPEVAAIAIGKAKGGGKGLPLAVTTSLAGVSSNK